MKHFQDKQREGATNDDHSDSARAFKEPRAFFDVFSVGVYNANHKHDRRRDSKNPVSWANVFHVFIGY
jgi:hypothetical protein